MLGHVVRSSGVETREVRVHSWALGVGILSLPLKVFANIPEQLWLFDLSAVSLVQTSHAQLSHLEF